MNPKTMDVTAVPVTAPLAGVYTCPVPHFPEAVGAVRRRAASVLAAWGMPGTAAQDALLVISELITNAVLHAMPPAELRLSLYRDGVSDLVRVEVTDAGAAGTTSWPDSVPWPDEGGRGTVVVTALAIRHGTYHGRGTITRWADLPA